MIDNQATEGNPMPTMRLGSRVLPIERLLNNPESIDDFLPLTSSKSNECFCVVAGSPFVASVSHGDLVIDYTIGTGSVLCSHKCTNINSEVKLIEDVWVPGRIVKPGLRCVVHDSIGVVSALLRFIGFNVDNRPYYEVIEETLKTRTRGVVVLDDSVDSMEIDRVEFICGNLSAPNPLHPASVVGKPHFSVCVRDLYTLIGPRSRLLFPLLTIDDDVPLVSLVSGLGEAIIIGFNVIDSHPLLRLAAYLGVLYTCGVDSEYH